MIIPLLRQLAKFALMTMLIANPSAFAASNKQLTIGLSQEFENLHPLMAQMTASLYIAAMVTQPIAAPTPAWQWQCVLCKTLPSLENKQAHFGSEKGQPVLYVDWEIKENAKWGDGKPVTGHDVKLAWEIGSHPAVSIGDKNAYLRIADIKVDAKNPKKFTLRFKEPRYDFYQLLISAVPAHLEGPIFAKTKQQPGIYEKQSLYTTDPLNPGLYNGPYLLKEIKLGSHAILERSPYYYGKKPAIERVVVKLIPNTQMLENNLISGDIDMINELSLSFDESLAFAKRLKQDPSLQQKYKVAMTGGMSFEHVDLNLRNPDLQDIRVRKALLYAVDRDKLSMTLFEGHQKKTLHGIHSKDVYYTEDVAQYSYDPNKAKKLLDEAGWKPGSGGIRIKDGRKLSFTLMTTSQNKSRELVQVFLQQEWKKVGVDLHIKNEPARVFFGETVRKAKYSDMAMFAWVSPPDNPPRGTLHSSEIPSAANGYSGQNSSGWSNRRVDQLLDEVYKEFDLNKRKASIAEVAKIYADEVPAIPLYMGAEMAVIPANLKGFVLTGHQVYSSLAIENWDLGPGGNAEPGP